MSNGDWERERRKYQKMSEEDVDRNVKRLIDEHDSHSNYMENLLAESTWEKYKKSRRR